MLPDQFPTARFSALARQPWWFWPVVALAGFAGLMGLWIVGPGLLELLSFKTIGLNYEAIRQHVVGHAVLAAVIYVVAYATLGAFVLPGSALFVIASGLLFGAVVGIPLSIFASTLAASLAFFVARTALGTRLAAWPSPIFHKFKAGFGRHALGYMLFLRLTPGLPFAVINVVPGLIGVSFSTFFLGTFLGLLPSRIALSTAGAGLAHAIDAQNVTYSQCLARATAGSEPCSYNIQVASLLTTETLAAFVALAFFALIPAFMDAAPGIRRRCRENS